MGWSGSDNTPQQLRLRFATKEEAIDYAWDFLVNVLEIPKDKLYATIFEGDKTDNVAFDEEAFNFWKKYLHEERILKGNKKDNFWEMGETGPCGPCSEIHIEVRPDDEIAKIPGSELVNKDNPRVIEIWTLVFIQYNRKADGKLELLPKKHVDTGMGFERLCRVVQDKDSNYDTDIFQPIIQKLVDISGKPYGNDEKIDIAHRVISDHLRSVSFAIADGQLPSNNKAGYVIRRILRRAVRYYYTYLELNEPSIFILIPTLIDSFGGAYPELEAQKELIEKVIKEEEQSFLRTLETGIKLLDSLIEEKKKQNETVLDGKNAFILYDTYGFPLDLTELILREKNFSVDIDGFKKEMEVQKSRSKQDSAKDTSDWTELLPGQTQEFIGYNQLESEIRIARYRKIKTKKKELFQLVFDKTPFYGESGGQVGDKGYIESEGEKISIIDTLKENNLIVHITEKLPKNTEAVISAVVSNDKRNKTANNHTATHLLHFALRKVLGEHVEQKGSLVGPDYLRFDFSHFQKVTDEEILKIEKIVNELIRKNNALEEFAETPIDEARKMGAMALFGEKYDDKVRVIKFGDSIELCGGTHVESTGNIGLFKITTESSIAAGIRRIEAITAEKAEDFILNKIDIVNSAQELLGSKPDTIIQKLQGLISENQDLKQKLESFSQKEAQNLKDNLKNSVRKINGFNFIAEKVEIDSAASIKDISFQLKNEIENLILILGAELDGKANLTIMISENLAKDKNLNAGQLIREFAKEIQGGGGGQPFYATAGGKNPNGLDSAISKALNYFQSELKN
jgi:alanyl-tRNA synthetase